MGCEFMELTGVEREIGLSVHDSCFCRSRRRCEMAQLGG